MRAYVVKQGDYLDKIAHAMGVQPDELWSDPKNAELKAKRDPNLLHPGDILYASDPKKKALPLMLSTHNVYVAQVPRTKIRVQFKRYDKPLANEPCLVFGMGEPEETTTDGDGFLEVRVPVHLREFEVQFTNAHVSYPIRLGEMDPVDEPSGVRKRLQNLGHYPMNSGDVDAADAQGIIAFQRAKGLPPTGTLDDATKAALTEAHGS